MTCRACAVPALLAGLAVMLTGAVTDGPVAQGASEQQGTTPPGDPFATWNSRGIAVRFPREMSPDRITVDTVVGDLFSGYEWRVALEGSQSVYLVALVITPDPETLAVHRYPTIEDAVRAGRSHIRQCERDRVTIRCGQPARALVRVVDGQLEFVISEVRWLLLATESAAPTVHLGVHRARESLWSAALPLVLVPD